MNDGSTTAIRRTALLPGAAIVLAWTPIFIRLAGQGGVPPLIIAADRMMIAALALGTYVLIFKRKSLRAFDRKAFIPAVFGGVFFGLHVFSFVAALEYTTVANAMLLLSTIPIFAAVLGHLFLKEKPHPVSYAAILLTIAGSALIVWGDIRWEPENLKGDLLALVSSFLGTWYFLMRRFVPRKERAEFFPYILTVYGTSAVVLLGIVLVAGYANRIIGYSSNTWLWLLLLGLFSTVVGHSLYNKALDYFKAHVAGTWILTEPILSASLAWIFISETFNTHVLWGVVPIYAGVVWILWLERDR